MLRRIEAHALYPDAVVVQYDTYPSGIPADYREALQSGHGFSSRHGNGLWKNFRTHAGVPVTIQVYRVRNLLRFTLKISVLRGLRSDAATDENGHRDNWLKAPDIRQDNRFVWRAVDAAISDATNYCEGVASQLAERCDANECAAQQNLNTISNHTTLISAEFAYDVAMEQPNAFVHEMVGELRRLGRRASRFDYGPPQETGTDGGSFMTAVKLRSGERLKVYAKTNRRVRFELQADSACLRRLCPDLCQRANPMRLSETVPFSRAFGVAAPQIVASFQPLIDQWVANRSTEDRVAFDLICAVHSSVRDDARAREILDWLVADQRLPASVGQATLARLRERGVIEHSARGVHPIARPFARAAQFLGTAPGFFSHSDVTPSPRLEQQ